MVFILKDVEKIFDQIEIESVDEQLYQTLEVNDFSQGNESQDLKLSIESSSEEKYEKINNLGLVRQPSQKLSINPAKFEQDKQLPGSSIDIMEKNPSYLSANVFSRQIEDESNYSVNQNNSNLRNNSFVVGSHLQPVSINYKSQLEQQQKDHRDKETLREVNEYLKSLLQSVLIKQILQMQINQTIIFFLIKRQQIKYGLIFLILNVLNQNIEKSKVNTIFQIIYGYNFNEKQQDK
ncbi:hypothetical protein ABPG72_001375 [Tetrahymena utriculariae]